jgi:dCTP deaminase
MIDPFEPNQVREIDGRRIVSYGTSSYGYDIRCSNEFKLFTNLNSTIVDPKNFDPNSFVEVKNDFCIIPPNSFALARTVEYFRIPRSVLTICLGKSTYARCGIIVNVTPFEPEWEGHVTLEFSNTTPLPAKIYANEGIAQVLFFESDEECETSYKDRGGKYQGQSGVTCRRSDLPGHHAGASTSAHRLAAAAAPAAPTPDQVLDSHAFQFPGNRHRQGLPLGKHRRAGYSGAGQGDRKEGLRGLRRHQLRRPDFVCPAAEPRLGLHPVDRRRRLQARQGRPDDRQPARLRQGNSLPQRGHPDLPLRRDAHLAPHPERRAARAARLHPHVRGHRRVHRPLRRPRGQGLPGKPGAALLPRPDALCRGRIRIPGTAPVTRAGWPS